MRLVEITQTTKPEVFLDMDGVQADFFGEISKRFNVDHYKAIVDQDAEINRIAHSGEDKVRDLFANLRPLSGGIKIVSWLVSNNIPYHILSAPLRGPHKDASKEGKLSWLQRHGLMPYKGRVIFDSNKFKYAVQPDGTPNILIDDYGKNIKEWRNAGGIAIKHEDEFEYPNSYVHTLKLLKQELSKFLD